VNFIRSSWGNQAGLVKVGDVEKLRKDDLKTTSNDDLGQVTQHN